MQLRTVVFGVNIGLLEFDADLESTHVSGGCERTVTNRKLEAANWQCVGER